MELTRTIRIRLQPTPEQASALTRTVEANRQALDYVSRIAFEHKIRNRVALHRAAYRTIRTRFGLRAQMACTVCRTVAATYKSMKSNGNEDTPAEFKHAKPVFQWNRDYVLRNGLAQHHDARRSATDPLPCRASIPAVLAGRLDLRRGRTRSEAPRMVFACVCVKDHPEAIGRFRRRDRR